MNLNEYQEIAKSFAFKKQKSTQKERLIIWALGITGESGEVADHLKKALRGDCSIEDKKEDIIKELGDVMWYVALMANELDISLEEVANKNINKLSSRKIRGKMRGSGDNR